MSTCPSENPTQNETFMGDTQIILEKIENYVREHHDIGVLLAAQELNLSLNEFLKIASSSPNLEVGKDGKTVRWKAYF